MKKLFALLMSVIMLLSLFAGCGDGGIAEYTAEPASEKNSEPVSEITSNVKEEMLPVEAVVTDSSEEVTSAAEMEMPTITITYPLEDPGETFTVWKSMSPSFYGFASGGYADFPIAKEIMEIIGVQLKFIEPTMFNEASEFQLMLASGDYPDLMNCASNYNGGMTAAYNEGVICDLTDYISDCAPDYWALYQNADEIDRQLTTNDEGQIFAVSLISTYAYSERGLCIREDWLDKLGLKKPETTDQLYDVLKAFYNAYQTPYTIKIDSDGILDNVVGAFGIAGASMTTNDLGLYVQDGAVCSSLTADGMYDYLTYMNQLYTDGLIDQGFYSANDGPADDLVIGGQTGVWVAMADQITTITGQCDDPDCVISSLCPIVASEGDVYTFADITTNVAVSNNTMSVSATCKNVTGALNLLNWFFTDEGSEITNYGIEGETFERADNGDVVYTELITDNPDGWSKANARTLYCFNQVMPQLYVSDSFFYLYDDITLDAISNWNSSSSEHTIPDLEYTSEEADIINQITAEIGTYANEQMLQFVTGAKSLTDENWTSYTAEIERMNLAEALDLIQDAYDRFTAR